MDAETPPDARLAAIYGVIDAIETYPDVAPGTLRPYVEDLEPAQRPKAIALHRTVMQRWLTLTYLLNLGVTPGRGTKPVEKFESPVLACLLVGGAELLFFESPAFAVIDEVVAHCRGMNRLKATGLVNALLRRLDERVGRREPETPWVPAADALPDGTGGVVRLAEPVLPDASNLVRHLAIATSHPRPLIRRWIEQHGEAAASRIVHSGVRTPSVFVSDGLEVPGLWDASAAGQDLSAWLADGWTRRVQDPAASLAVRAAVDQLGDGFEGTVLDACAGRGTKTRQMLACWPNASVVAWDPDADRRADLAKLQAAVGRPRLELREARTDEAFDLVLLDVPCSNAGVLGRRPEARYRWSAERVGQVVALQREIIGQALRHVRPGGCVLYTTCSIDAEENQRQAGFIREQAAAPARSTTVLAHSLHLPGGFGPEATDGSYHALIQFGPRVS